LTALAAAVASGSSNSTLNDIEPGVLGFLVVAAMGLMLFFLLRNMNKQFKKIGPKPEEPGDPDAGAGDAGDGASSSAGTPVNRG
jgi:hypothetical protein